MESRDLIQILILLVIGIVSWLLRTIWTRHDKLVDVVMELEKKLPTHFASREDLRAVQLAIRDSENILTQKIDKLGDKIEKFWERLDTKADK